MKKFKLGFSIMAILLIAVVGIKVMFFTPNAEIVKYVENNMTFLKIIVGFILLDDILFYLTYTMKMLALIEKDKLIETLTKEDN